MTDSKKHHRLDSANSSDSSKYRKRQKKQNKIEKPEDPKDPKEVYYESNGLQRIHPYFHNFATYAKGRWVGRTVFEVFSKEFRDRPVDYYLKAIKQGLIEINGQRVDKDTIVRNSDIVTHYIHRHEPPVTLQPLGIVENIKDGLLLVDKPGSIPVHPTGRYNFNSVIKILQIKHGYSSLYPVNRLDRLTSGLMLVGLNPDVARRMERDLTSHRIQKEYICKAKGVFPRGKIVCDQPIRVVAHKLSLNCVDPKDGKPSLTEFELLSTDGTHSIVYCRPKTGRTHQIRVHLQFLGYPIANDPLYCNREVWGESLGRNGVFPKYDKNLSDNKDEDKGKPEKEESQKAADLSETRPKMSGQRDADNIEPWVDLVKRMEEWKTKQELIEQISNSVDTQGVPRVCDKCTDPVLPDPKPDELCIWLHAWRYSGPGWSYETPLPEWANEAKQHIDRVKYIPDKSEP